MAVGQQVRLRIPTSVVQYFAMPLPCLVSRPGEDDLVPISRRLYMLQWPALGCSLLVLDIKAQPHNCRLVSFLRSACAVMGVLTPKLCS
jgi:hypothetical protein